MAEEVIDLGRRRFLTATTAVVGGIGGVFAAVPFFSAFKPSAAAISAGAPVSADISNLQEGQQIIIAWRKRPVWIIRRSPALIEGLKGHDDRLKDPASRVSDQQPDYARNEYRSIKPEILVLVGVCTHLGCSPSFVPEMRPQPFAADWRGGFYCPCHNSKFDMAGRVYSDSPAPTNLVVPPHRFDSETMVTIGLDPVQGAA